MIVFVDVIVIDSIGIVGSVLVLWVEKKFIFLFFCYILFDFRAGVGVDFRLCVILGEGWS